MPRILLLAESTADFQSMRSAELLAQHLGAGFEATLRTIGPAGTYASSADALYRVRKLRDDFDLIHAWGPRALTLAVMAARLPLLYSPPPVAGRRMIQWARAICHYRNVHILCPTSTLRRLHVESGIPVSRTHLLRPGVDFGRVNRKRRDPDLRSRLGFSAEDRVLLAIGEHTHGSHHVAAVWASGILNVLDRRYKLLLWGRGPQAAYLARLAPKVRQSHMIAIATREIGANVEYEDVLSAADVAIASPKGLVPTLPIAITMAAGVPIVASVTYTTSELLEDRHSALMIPNPAPKLLAKRISDLYDSAQLQWAIADRARAEAYDFYPLTKFISQYRTVCQQLVAGSAVEISDQGNRRPVPIL